MGSWTEGEIMADLICVKSLHDRCNCFKCRDERDLSGEELSALGWKKFDEWCKKYITKHPEAEDLNALELCEIYNGDKDDIPKDEVGGPMTLKEAYDKGFRDGLRDCGDYYDVPFLANEQCEGYDPPKEEELTIDLRGTLPHVKGTPHISRDIVFDGEEEKFNTFHQWADHVEGKK